MSQLGIPKMRQTSHFLWRKPSAVRSGHLRFQSKGNSDKPPFDGSTGGTLRAHPGLARGQTHLWNLMDMHTELIAVPHASLRNPNPEKPGEGVCAPLVKGQRSNVTRRRTGRDDGGRSCLQRVRFWA